MKVHNYTFYDVISRNARVCPDKAAIVFENIRLNYGEYKKQCDCLASGLAGAGLAKGDRIAVIAQNSDKFLILYGAAAKMGAIILPVNWRMQQYEVEHIICDARPKFVFAGSDYQEMIADIVKKYPSVEKCYALDDDHMREGFLPFLSLGKPDKGEEPAYIDGSEGFILMYTAAVNGKPRGALLSQSNIIAINMEMTDQYVLNGDDCNLCFLPLFHIAGLSMCTAIMQNGGRNVIMDRFDAGKALQLIVEEKVSVFFNFSPILKMITDKYEEKKVDLSSVRKIGGLESLENMERFGKIAKNVRFYTAYGQTEAMAITGGPMDEKPGSAGKPSILANIVLFDDYDNAVPVGTPGEICVRSPAVFCGYWELDEENIQTFRNGWHHTGDIGRFDEDGFLWYVKRKAQKDLIKPGGENVYPAEVEKAILAHECVDEVCVIGVPDKEWGEAIKAVLVLRSGKQSVTLQQLADFLADRIARYKKPKYLVCVNKLPKASTGEIDREKVKELYGQP